MKRPYICHESKLSIMETNINNVYEKMYGKKFKTIDLNLEGYEEPVPFDIYDGFAVCEDYKGHQLVMEYPQMKAIKESKEFSKAIIDYVGKDLTESAITPLHSLMTFNKFYVDGVLINSEDK